MNLDATIYIRSKYMKELKIFILCNNLFALTNDFDSSGGRVMKFPASGHRSLLTEVSGKCKYSICTKIFRLYWDNIPYIYQGITKIIWMLNDVKRDFKIIPASIALVPGSLPTGVEFF